MIRLGLALIASSAVLLFGCSSADDAAAPQDPAPDPDKTADGGKKKKTGPGGETDDPDGGAPPGTDPDSGTTPTGASLEGVQRYGYAFDLQTRRATSKVSIALPAAGDDCVSIACRTAAADDATWNTEKAKSSSLDSGKLKVCGPEKTTGRVEISAVTPQVPTQTFFGLDVGYSQKADRAGGTFSYLLSWVGSCDRFGPCDPDPGRLAELHFEVTHPDGTLVLCPGKLTAGATSTKCDIEGTLAPTYSGFALAADPKWTRKAYTSAAGVDVVMYEVPGGTIATSLDKASLGEFLGWITGLLGPMPYGPELRVAGAPTAWLGFEHPANIILDERLGDSTASANGVQHVLMHEIIHQWSGDRTTLATANDFVWKESIAEYLAYVFEDEHRPAGEAAATRAYWDSISTGAQHRPRPTDNATVDQFYGDVYGPGPLVLFLQPESLFGRPAVLAAIKAFLSKPGTRSVDDLRAELEKASGKDLKKYFDAWVVGPGAPEWPSFKVTFQQVGNQLTVNVAQANASNTIYPCKVDVDITGTGGAKVRATVDFGVAPTAATASTTVTFSGARTAVTVDPDHRLISRSATTQSGPISQKVWIY